MLIELANEFDRLSSREDWAPYCDAIGNLVNAHASGHHIFLPSRDAISSLLSLTYFGERQKSVLNQIRENYSEYSGLARELEFTILAIMNTDVPTMPEYPNQIKKIPVVTFENEQHLNPFYLIVENIDNDGAFLCFLCDVLAKNHGLANGPPIRLANGGGATTCNVYAYQADLGVPAYCVVDSDKKFPDAPFGNTAKALFQKVRELGHENQGSNRFIDWRILEVHELENFIPPTILREIFSEELHLSEAIDKIGQLETFDKVQSGIGEELMRFVDLKNGLRKTAVLESNPNQKDYAFGVWNVLNPDVALDDVQINDEGYILQGLGSNIFARLLAWTTIPRHKRRFQAHIESNQFIGEICELVADVIAYAAASEKVTT